MLYPSASEADLQALQSLVIERAPVAILTGAGCSTESGIPDYRGANGTWNRRRPMQYAEFMRSEASRRHYWARNYLGWPTFDAAQPNSTHVAITSLETLGYCRMVITQNVDALHRRAGSSRLIELHGQSDRVVCTDCGERTPRLALQMRMRELNPHWSHVAAELNPDADAELTREETESFEPPCCERCRGILKPDVVFFGENVPRDRVEAAMRAVEEAGALIVAGSSLTVWSGYRFALRAHEAGLPVAIINVGDTRADRIATLKIEARCGNTLSRLAASLQARKARHAATP